MDLFDLVAKITLDSSGYDEGVEDADQKGRGLAGTIGNGLATAAKVGTAAITAAAGGIAALTGASIKGYAEQEQLIGGIETMFEDLTFDIQENAKVAYKTAGLSANEYMDTVMGFSAALTSSLKASEGNIARSADLSNQIVVDMSDNANKMGSSMESIQNAYSGFAKQNYTMLDNLKLGYGGTKEEMQRLLTDAEKLTGKKFDISNFADVAEAIHAVQVEMGIAGTTSKEAASTISGSVSSVKSAWSNLVTGMADENADFEGNVEAFVDSVGIAAENILPRIEVAFSGIGMLVEELAPMIGEKIPEVVTNVLPSLISGGVALLQGIISGIVSALPQIYTTAAEMAGNLYNGIVAAIPKVMESIPVLITKFVNFLTEHFPAILSKGVEIVSRLAVGIIQGIPKLVGKLPELITALVRFITTNLPVIVEQGFKLIANLANGITKAIPSLARNIPGVIAAIVQGLIDGIPKIFDVGKDIVKGLWNGIKNAKNWLGDNIKGFFGGIVDGAKDLLGIHSPSTVFAEIGGNMAAGIGKGWNAEYSSVKRGITDGMDFGTASVDFASSGIGIHSQNTIDSLFAAQGAATGGEYTINLVMDSEIVATHIFDPLRGIVKQGGVGLA